MENQEGNYILDPDGDGPIQAFTVRNNDFSYRTIRINSILRWEFKPGSTLYCVWQQQRDDFESGDNKLETSKDFETLFNAQPVNTFLVKISYWMGY